MGAGSQALSGALGSLSQAMAVASEGYPTNLGVIDTMGGKAAEKKKSAPRRYR